jgi:hypothetical protein
MQFGRWRQYGALKGGQSTLALRFALAPVLL